jgi:hypothetical protein
MTMPSIQLDRGRLAITVRSGKQARKASDYSYFVYGTRKVRYDGICTRGSDGPRFNVATNALIGRICGSSRHSRDHENTGCLFWMYQQCMACRKWRGPRDN